MYFLLSFLLFAQVFITGSDLTVTTVVSPTTTVKVPTSTAGTPAETAKPGAPSSSHDVKTTYDVTATYNVTATHVPPMTSSRQAGVNPTATTTGKDAVSSTPTAQQSTEVKIEYYVNITLTAKYWNEAYSNDSSQIYKNLEQELIDEFSKEFSISNFNLTKVSLTGFHNQSGQVMAQITLRFGKAPPNDPKDPVEQLNEIKGEMEIGSFGLRKIDFKEHIPDNANITSEWSATNKDCCSKCTGTGGQVKQTRDCEGSGCDGHVMTMRYVKCSDGCTNKDKCSTGSHLVFSTNVFAAALFSAFIATMMTI